jgi:hypothetical protein
MVAQETCTTRKKLWIPGGPGVGCTTRLSFIDTLQGLEEFGIEETL